MHADWSGAAVTAASAARSTLTNSADIPHIAFDFIDYSFFNCHLAPRPRPPGAKQGTQPQPPPKRTIDEGAVPVSGGKPQYAAAGPRGVAPGCPRQVVLCIRRHRGGYRGAPSRSGLPGLQVGRAVHALLRLPTARHRRVSTVSKKRLALCTLETFLLLRSGRGSGARQPRPPRRFRRFC